MVNFQPVGEEEFTAVIDSEDGHVAIIVDKDGFTKAQSKALRKEEAISIFKKLTRIRDGGISRKRDSNLVSNKTNNSKRIQNKLIILKVMQFQYQHFHL